MHPNNFRKGHCLHTEHSTLKPLSGADIEFTVGDHIGTGRVIWTDYDYALLYECSHPNEDGSCDPQYVNMAVYGHSRELPESVIEELHSVTACVTREDFEMIPQAGEQVFFLHL